MASYIANIQDKDGNTVYPATMVAGLIDFPKHENLTKKTYNPGQEYVADGSFYIERTGHVCHLSGSFKCSQAWYKGTTLEFTPAGYIPTDVVRFFVNGNALAYITGNRIISDTDFKKDSWVTFDVCYFTNDDFPK